MFQKIVTVVFIVFLGYSHITVVKPDKEIDVEMKEVVLKGTSFQDSLIALAKSKMGSPYVYAKAGPNSFDCSGYTYYLFKEHNITLPRTSLAQSTIGKKLNRQEIQRGDLLFFDTSGKGGVNHSGVYLGGGKFIHASSGKAKGVTTSSLDAWYKDKFLWGVRRE